jgi:hypothetical protein
MKPSGGRRGGQSRRGDSRTYEDCPEGGHPLKPLDETSAHDQLVPLIVTGIVKTAPWQALSEAFDMLAAPLRLV